MNGSNQHPDRPPISETRTQAPGKMPGPEAAVGMIGEYTILEKLGSGGFGDVLLAFDSRLQRKVAVKKPKEGAFAGHDQLRRFVEEARSLAKLKHPGIVQVYEVNQQGDRNCYVVMEYVEGESLRELLDRKTASLVELVEILSKTAEAAHHAHEHEIVHRDLKPSNILIETNKSVRVCDFGLALSDRVRGEPARQGVAGTRRRYMAPEQVRGETFRCDGRTDVWAIGVMLYEAMTGRRAFGGADGQAIDREVLHVDPKPPRQIDASQSAELERICLKCLSKKIADRYASALDLANDLGRWLALEEQSARTVPARRLLRQRKAFLGLLVVSLAAAAALVVWAFARPSPLPPLALHWVGTVWREEEEGQWSGLQLGDRMTIHQGDEIKIGFTPHSGCYVYLVNVDASHQVNLLFPSRLIATEHSCRANQYYEIPDGDQTIQLEKAPGSEELYLIASYDRLADLEALPLELSSHRRWDAFAAILAMLSKSRQAIHTRGGQRIDRGLVVAPSQMPAVKMTRPGGATAEQRMVTEVGGANLVKKIVLVRQSSNTE